MVLSVVSQRFPTSQIRLARAVVRSHPQHTFQSMICIEKPGETLISSRMFPHTLPRRVPGNAPATCYVKQRR